MRLRLNPRTLTRTRVGNGQAFNRTTGSTVSISSLRCNLKYLALLPTMTSRCNTTGSRPLNRMIALFLINPEREIEILALIRTRNWTSIQFLRSSLNRTILMVFFEAMKPFETQTPKPICPAFLNTCPRTSVATVSTQIGMPPRSLPASAPCGGSWL